jgi:hypothetical protein
VGAVIGDCFCFKGEVGQNAMEYEKTAAISTVAGDLENAPAGDGRFLGGGRVVVGVSVIAGV